MSSNCEHNDLLLMRSGTSQSQRYIDALDPQHVKLHDLTTEDWMRFALKFSKEVNYFETTKNKISGDWSDFFKKRNEIETFVETLKDLEESISSDSKVEPHLTLFATFLKLTSFSQERLNNLSKRHLDFYYKEVLKLDNKAPVEDKVHLLFELAKNATEVRIKESTALDAGKDDNGIKRIYKSQDEIIVNKASVAFLQNVFHEDGVGVKNALVANSYDGLGEDFPDDEIRWWPFGYPTNTLGATQDAGSYPNLPFAKTGFGLSSPVLLLKEGQRIITFTIALGSFDTSVIASQDLPDVMTVYFSGEKEWIAGTIVTDLIKPEGFPDDHVVSSLTAQSLKIVVLLDQGTDPVMNYDKEVLLEPYNTTNPVARFLVNNSTENDIGNSFQQLFSATEVENVTIQVSVDAIQDIIVENDLGILDASKPFYPFGPQPVTGSNFFIGIPEALDKNWTKITVDLEWKDKPNLEENYFAYCEEFRKNISKNSYDLTVDDTSGEIDLDGNTQIVQSEDYFTATIEVLESGVWKKENTPYKLFGGENLEITKDADVSTDQKKSLDSIEDSKNTRDKKLNKTRQSINEKFTAGTKKGFIRAMLDESFLHELFPKIYSIAIAKFYNDNVLIPNPPYTPQVETIKVGYVAEAKTVNNDVKLFHEHPFGISQESEELKENSVLKTSDRPIRLLPTYKKGALFIALENAKILQSISLLVQTLEGSENPETTNDFEEGEKLEWSILCNNEWLSLNRDYIITNNTDNFLKTGIVKLSIPREATKDNTKLPSGYFWVKVDNPRDFDTVSQLIDIKTQAVLAQFENNDNDLSHLQYGIPAGTISKLIERLANVKGVSQDYGSFDGKPEETDQEFYRRISERLRHKQRAITIWDYKHLILQEFPDIYKVNCLNHTSLTSFLSPGNVTIVVIPNIINQNVYDPYKPRISKAKRNEIQDFINQLNTLHVTAQVINPVYEEVKVILNARFYEGKDESFYSTQLQKDIAKLLAPWAFEETSSIDFGVTLHESTVIDYIEKLDYVDYIADFELKQEDGVDENDKKKYTKVKKVVPSSAKVILTSVKFTDHTIGTVAPECNGVTNV